MERNISRLKYLLMSTFVVCLFNLSACSSEGGGSSGALPQPSVNCGGSSCVE